MIDLDVDDLIDEQEAEIQQILHSENMSINEALKRIKQIREKIEKYKKYKKLKKEQRDVEEDGGQS